MLLFDKICTYRASLLPGLRSTLNEDSLSKHVFLVKDNLICAQEPTKPFHNVFKRVISLPFYFFTLPSISPSTGNVWIYSIFPANYNEEVALHCNKTLYLFAFWTTTLVYIFLGMLMVGGCCVLVCMCLCGGRGLGSNNADV